MQVGDLVRYYKDNTLGIIVADLIFGYTVWFPEENIRISYIAADEVELADASR